MGYQKAGAKFVMEIWGIEPQTSHMQSERSTTELYPRTTCWSGCYFELISAEILQHCFEVHEVAAPRPCPPEIVSFSTKATKWLHKSSSFGMHTTSVGSFKINPLASMGVEPMTFALLARRSNQLS